MRLTRDERARALRAAAALAGYHSLGDWADAHGMTRPAVYRWSEGRVTTDRLDRIVDEFVLRTIVPWYRTVLLPAVGDEEAA